MVIGALVIVLSIVMLIASNSIKVIASSLTAVIMPLSCHG